jgi:KDO2-lipid IV(A) lauroyltransferase
MMSRLGVWFMACWPMCLCPCCAPWGLALGGCCLCSWCHGARCSAQSGAVLSAGHRLSSARWARESFIVFCQTWLDRSWLWSAPQSVVEQRVKLQGAVHELDGDVPTIIFAPHFYGLDAGGLVLPLRTSRAFTSIFSTHPDPVIDAWFMAGRQRFGDVRMLNRADGVKPIISNLRKGGLLYLLSDMDFGAGESIFVPFYGVPAATVPSLSRFARLGRAKVIGMYTRLTPDGYVAELTPAWDHYPTDDVEADTARMNRELESYINTMPGQYYWVHKRFKTRPEGQPSLYK